MERTDVLVIGGSASGIVAAVTGKSFYPEKCLARIFHELLAATTSESQISDFRLRVVLSKRLSE
jgi:thioredoxin reductase